MTIRLTRRRFLLVAASAAGIGLAAACAPISPPAPAATSAPTVPAAGASPAAAAPAATSKPIAPVAAASPATAASPVAASASPGASPAASPVRSGGAPAANPAAANPNAKKGGTLTFARTADIQSFNPTMLQPGHYPFLRALYNTPVRYDQTLNPRADLAETFALSPDGKTFTMTLKKGVQFHSGRELTAEDVAFTIEWFRDPKNASPVRSAVDLVKKVDTPDKYSVTLTFDAPNPGVYDMLDLLFVVDKGSVDQFSNAANGTGPFKLAQYTPGDMARFVSNPNYFESGKPYLNEYVVKVTPDAQSMAIQLESGATDVIWIPNFNDLVRLGQDARFQTSPGAPGAFFWDVAVNTSVPDLSDKRVRQAISYVIDRERYAKTIMLGLVPPTSLNVPQTSWAYFKDLEGAHARNIDKAKQLMADAGKSAGFDVVLLTSSKRGAGMGELAQILQNDLAQINIRARIEDVEVAVYEPRSREAQFDLACHSYGRANKDPGTLYTGAIAWFPKGSWTKIDDPVYAAQIQKAGSLVDRAARIPEYRKLQEYVLDQSFTIPVCEQPRAFAWNKKVQDFAVTLDNIPYVGDVWLNG
jgi:peptide/nickel transport system substrate-binding protein